MAYGLIDHDTLTDIANSIRYKTESQAQYRPKDMATAILQIPGGSEGFDEPVVFNPRYINCNNRPPIGYGGMKRIEVISDSDLANVPDLSNYELVKTHIEWAPMSPGKIDLYFKNEGDGFVYYFVIEDKFTAKKISFICMDQCCYSNSNLRSPFCGTYTGSLRQAFYQCTYTDFTTAVCGENVTDMYYAYAYCNNLETAACGENVVDMSYAYYYCQKLTHAEIGPNVEILADAYYGCVALSHDIVIPEKVRDIRYAFSQADLIQNIAILTDKLPDDEYISNYVLYAFTRTDKTLRRNVVITNLRTYTILKDPQYLVFYDNSSIEYTEEIYDEPVTVTVAETDYSAVRCAYNEMANTYIYYAPAQEENANNEGE